MKSKVALIGSSGYVGGYFLKLLEQNGIEVARFTRPQNGNLKTALAAFVAAEKPEFLINCAGYTGKPNVDACELHKAECLEGNAVLPGTIAEVCADAKLAWGHVSSGCIYSGRRPDGKGFLESDTPNFSFRSGYCSFYSGTKALGEEVLADAPNCYIWRLRIPFDEIDNPRNYLTKLIRYDSLLEAENSISEVNEFVSACWQCWDKKVPFGTYNVTNPGFVTTREVVDLIVKSGVSTKAFKFFENEASFMKLAAKTPRSNCVMDTTKLTAAGIQLTEVHEAVARALANWKKA
jgi:dTDP-4-dehydrorhamnose reductase